MDDLEVAAGERELELRADAERHPDPAAARDRHRRPDRDDLTRGARVERAAALEEFARPARGREHGHLVPERAKLRRHAGDVLVDVVGLRPVERRDEADAHGGAGHSSAT